jgi:hypothetical protein
MGNFAAIVIGTFVGDQFVACFVQHEVSARKNLASKSRQRTQGVNQIGVRSKESHDARARTWQEWPGSLGIGFAIAALPHGEAYEEQHR